MKTYRGSLLAAAVLFATLPYSGCGDASDYAQTSEITLAAATVEPYLVGTDIIFTVTASFPDPTTTTTTPTTTTTTTAATLGNALKLAVVNTACDTLLEYQATGTRINHSWRSIPGTESTRSFVLRPPIAGTLLVQARGKCSGSLEEWTYASLSIEVTAEVVVVPGLPTITLDANPSSVVVNNPVTFALSTDHPEGCSVGMKYQYSGAGFGVTTVNPATAGQFILTPTAVGTLTVTATAWCSANRSSTSVTTTTVDVTAAASATITSPSTPAFAAPVNSGVTETFSSGGSVCSNGEAVQYQFTALGGPAELNPTNWSSSSSTTFTWAAAGGPYTVSVQARCATSGTTSVIVPSAAFTIP